LFGSVTCVGNDYTFQLLLVGMIVIALIIEEPQVVFVEFVIQILKKAAKLASEAEARRREA
jgi:hypothetical protein